MSIEQVIQEFTKSVVSLTEAINAQTAVLTSQPGTVAAKPTKPVKTPAAETAKAEPAAAAAEPAAEPAAKAEPVPNPPSSHSAQAKVGMAELGKKAMEMVKACGGSKDKLLEVMKGVQADAVSIPTVKPENYVAVFEAIDNALTVGDLTVTGA